MLLELASGKQYLERHVSVTMNKDEHASAHTGTLGQPLLTFYVYGDHFLSSLWLHQKYDQRKNM